LNKISLPGKNACIGEYANTAKQSAMDTSDKNPDKNNPLREFIGDV
jgi:hypothetical protein